MREIHDALRMRNATSEPSGVWLGPPKTRVMELQLISASSSAGNPVDCTLIYPLDDKAHGLPVVDETYPWAGKTISALRDRL